LPRFKQIISVDDYVLDVLMRDLIGHDQQPAAYHYPFAGLPAWQIIGAAFLLIGVTAFCLLQRRIRPYLIVGWLRFLGTLVPVIGLVQVGGQTMADRYFDIPSIGLFIAMVFGLADIIRSWGIAPFLSAGTAAGVLLIFATLTNAQIQRWHDSFTLFEHTLAVTPPNLHIEYNLGMALGASSQYTEAAAHFEKDNLQRAQAGLESHR
jgi:hypothetical protein